MVNQDTTDTTRAEKLSISIEDSELDIKKLHLVIQKVGKIKDELCSFDFSDEFNKIIEKGESQIKYLEDLKKSDEIFLNKIIDKN